MARTLQALSRGYNVSVLLRLALIGILATGLVGVIPTWLMLTLAAIASLAIVGDFLWTLRTVRRTRVPTGTEALVGKTAIARTALAPEGFVLVQGERWLAEMEEGRANPGDRVRIVGASGFRLRVRRRE
jgi:membrane-bound serine protease (ClpP class)